jgi:hypothetical protein
MLTQIGSYFATGLGRIAAFLPNLLSAAIVVAIGYLLSRLAGSATRRLLSRTRLDEVAARRLHPRVGGLKGSASAALGSAVFWLGLLITASIAANSLGLAALSVGINRIVGYLPNLIVAVVIVVAGVAVSRVLAGIVDTSAGTLPARAAQVAVMVFAGFMALDQLGVARNIVMTTFVAFLGAAAIAAAIAFGIGNISTAREYSQRWAARRAQEKKIAEATAPIPRVVPTTYVGESTDPTKH